jgi:hypothetical protein
LLRLPAFLRQGEGGPNGWSDQDLQDGFALTGLFLLRHVLEPRGQGHNGGMASRFPLNQNKAVTVEIDVSPIGSARSQFSYGDAVPIRMTKTRLRPSQMNGAK